MFAPCAAVVLPLLLSRAFPAKEARKDVDSAPQHRPTFPCNIPQPVWFPLTILFAAGTFASSATYVFHDENLFLPGWGLNPNSYPIGCVKFLHEEGIVGPVYNSYSTGGFLVVQGPKGMQSFQDGRNLVCEEAYIALRKTPLKRLFSEVYPLDIAVVNYPPREFPEIVEFFANSIAWQMVFWDDVAMVFVRTSAYPEEFLSRWDLSTLPAISNILTEADPAKLQRAWEETSRILVVFPDCMRAHFIRAQLSARKGDLVAARRHLERARLKYRDTQEYREFLAFLQSNPLR
jgi:hypothetical protein